MLSIRRTGHRLGAFLSVKESPRKSKPAGAIPFCSTFYFYAEKYTHHAKDPEGRLGAQATVCEN